MSNAESADSRVHSRSARTVNAVEVRVTAQLESLAVLRTIIGAVSTFEDLDLDTVADLRLAVDEACTRLIRSAGPDASLVVVIDPRPNEVVVEVSTETTATDDILPSGSFSWHVLTSLTDDVRTFRDGADVEGAVPVFGIALTTRRVSPAR
ncbi:anti-sigma-F factor RsbW [Mycolicibacterium chitae]|uniref:Anti-sigma factor RsbW n=1 Tax=Mycolicibacterium chitae TaxID=1792 RepID=A0A3S4TNS9_MYCCI|nr:ATP-binding protein [Mycolicibacterium chitae]MCV7105110.1 ATP-binding protein [Mycolicibacterium chitae]BBZ05609.1 anti-sigma-F factor RsbW [Mycolicibacterium chitae]VEG49221.1 anti-sigma factor RsbW [Mycolicibacterium chitae]